MKLSQLQQYSSIHRYGNFTKAAQALYITQPALSMSIRDLEEELGEQLIVRTNRSISFTPIGEQVLNHADRILDEAAKIYQLCKGTGLYGHFEMAATPHHCASLIIPLKLKLESKYPDLEINMRECDSRTTLDLVASGELTAGLVQHCDIGHIVEDLSKLPATVQLLPLFDEDMVVVVSQHHPILLWDKISVRDLAAFPYTAYKNAENIWVKRFSEGFTDNPPVQRVNDTVPLRILLRESNGYTIIPKRALEYGNSIYKDPLIPLNLDGIDLSTKISLAISSSASQHITTLLHEDLLEVAERYFLSFAAPEGSRS